MGQALIVDYREIAQSEIDGPFRFVLKRMRPGLTRKTIVAYGVMFADSACSLRWRSEHASTAVYQTHDDLMAIHGHGDETDCEWLDKPPSKEFREGALHCAMDSTENAPFSSIGGLEARANPIPKHATKGLEDEYLRGYITAARAAYGEDWQTCEFSWGPALTISANERIEP